MGVSALHNLVILRAHPVSRSTGVYEVREELHLGKKKVYFTQVLGASVRACRQHMIAKAAGERPSLYASIVGIINAKHSQQYELSILHR